MILGCMRSLLRRAHYRLKGYPLYRHLAFLEQSQYFSRSEIEALQDEKLRNLVEHAYRSVPYYRRKMSEMRLTPADIRNVKDIAKLPVLERTDIRDHGTELLATDQSIGKTLWAKTGGTTGVPLSIANDLRGTSWANAAYFRGLRWAGYDMDQDRLAVLFGGSMAPDRTQTSQVRRQGRLRLFLSAYDLTKESFPNYYHALREFQPCFMKAYSSVAYLLAKCTAEESLPPPAIRAVFTTSEKEPAWMRKGIEENLNVPVYNYYGSVEINSLGYPCPENRAAWHIPEEHVIIEAHEMDCDASPLGGGAFVITDLDNYRMPLIRYRNGDAGLLSDLPCVCGRTSRKIDQVFGRTTDFLWSTTGSLVSGGVVDYIFGETKKIRQYCLIQEEPTLCIVQYVPDGPEAEIEQAVSQLKQFLGDDMVIVTEAVASIPLTGSGKRRFIVSKLMKGEHGPLT